MKRSVVYVMPIKYPNHRAHTIQITRTVNALAARVDVYLVVHRRRERQDWRRDVRDRLGIEPSSRLRVVEIPKPFLTRRWFPIGLLLIALRVRGPMVFYARRYPIAENLLRTRWLHRSPIVFESHKQPGSVTEGATHPPALVEKVYREADGLVFLHPGSLEDFQPRYAIEHAIYAWYGLDASRLKLSGDRPNDLVYCGSLRDSKFQLLAEAVTKLSKPAVLDVFGGSDEEVETWQRKISAMGMSGRFRFRGRVSYRALCEALPRYRLGLTTLEGIKVIDYIEAGVIPTVPRIPVNTTLFGDDEVLFYRAGDASDLANCIDCWLEHPSDNRRLRDIAERHSIARRVDGMCELFGQL